LVAIRLVDLSVECWLPLSPLGFDPGLGIGLCPKAALGAAMTAGEGDLNPESGRAVWDHLVISHALNMARAAGPSAHSDLDLSADQRWHEP
jgi:hypothetical protein